MVAILLPIAGLLMTAQSAFAAGYYGGQPMGPTCGVPNGDSSYLTNIEVQQARRRMRSDDDDSVHLEPRIVGGTDVPGGTGSLCWEVSIQIKTKGTNVALCAGTIVGSRTILTSAFCALYSAYVSTGIPGFPVAQSAGQVNVNLTANPVTVTIGAITLKIASNNSDAPTSVIYPETVQNCARNFSVESVAFQNYNLNNGDNGVGILVLSQPIDFSANGACACKLCLSRKTPAVGDTCVVSGWSHETSVATLTPSGPLRYVKQKIQPLSNDPNLCVQTPAANTTVPIDRFYCAGGVVGEDWCDGDQGAPLFCYDPINNAQYLAGIAEQGTSACATGVSSRYTKVSLYLQWIVDNAPAGDVTIQN